MNQTLDTQKKMYVVALEDPHFIHFNYLFLATLQKFLNKQ